MKQKIVKRYSICFKRQVIADLEGGRFDTIGEVQRHYGITGNATVQKWLQKYGKNHLLPKVIRVQKPNEKDQIRQLKQQVAELQRVLGQTQVDNVLNEEFLKIACEELGCDVETIKKKADTEQSPRPGNDQA
jgi:transposase